MRLVVELLIYLSYIMVAALTTYGFIFAKNRKKGKKIALIGLSLILFPVLMSVITHGSEYDASENRFYGRSGSIISHVSDGYYVEKISLAEAVVDSFKSSLYCNAIASILYITVACLVTVGYRRNDSALQKRKKIGFLFWPTIIVGLIVISFLISLATNVAHSFYWGFWFPTFH